MSALPRSVSPALQSISAACSSPRPSCCCPAAWASARNTRASRASRTATSAPSCSRAPRCKPRLGNPPHRVYETPAGHAERHRPAEPRRRPRRAADPADARFHRDALHRQRVAARRSRNTSRSRGASMIRRSTRSRSTSRARTSRKAASRSATTRTCRRRWSRPAARRRRKPLITKLSPNQTDIRENARRCIEAGTDALAVINTIMGMAIDVKHAPAGDRQRAGRSVGAGHQADRAAEGAPGVRGRAPASTCRSSARAASPRANDALEFLIAGATAVGIGTALFYDPLVCPKINAGIAEYLAASGMDSVHELIGSLQLPAKKVEACAC